MKRIYPGLWMVCILFGLISAASRAWTCDDAFISFRYARNLAEGRGLVFNAGERVEGYTNFLWTVFEAGVMRMGVDPLSFASAAGVTCFGILLFVLTILPRRRASTFVLPFAPAFCAVLLHMQIYATSGLETMLFTLLVTAGFLLAADVEDGAVHTDRETRVPVKSKTGIGFFLLCCAVLTRPDGVLFYAVAALFYGHKCFSQELKEHRLTRLHSWTIITRIVRVHVIPALVLATFAAWKLLYYGDLLPNTFYAKSAERAYAAQGTKYIGLFFASYWILLVPFLGYVMLRMWMSWKSRDVCFVGTHNQPGAAIAMAPAGEEVRESYMVPLLVMIGIWLSYVTWIGGDFMFARFLIPVVPLIVVAGEKLIGAIAAEKMRSALFPAFILLGWILAAALRYDPYKGEALPVISGISEESKFYTPARISLVRSLGEELAPFVRTSGVRLAFVGAQASLIYYLAPGIAIESETGLTDRLIARQPLESRGRIGHEKTAAAEYLQSRGIHLLLRPTMDQGAGTVEIEGLPGRFPILKYDKSVFSELAKSPRIRIHHEDR